MNDLFVKMRRRVTHVPLEEKNTFAVKSDL